MNNFRTTFFLFFFLILFQNLYSQIIIKGEVRDTETGLPLPAANIQIEGTYKGTISNEQGQYILKADSLPSTLIVSYIGYATSRIRITEETGSDLVIRLIPVSYELEPIVVTGEDPAIRIMREVIERKKQWRARLNSYQAEAYTRLVLENDTSITSIMESISTVFWERKKGVREIIRSKRQTSNMAENENFANVALVKNLYDDNIEIAGYELIGVTHPDALDHYRFKLVGQRRRDSQTVFDILVQPKGKLQPTFEGQISVLDSAFALLEVDLHPGKSVLFPPPVQNFQLNYRQQFSNFGGPFWLPVDIRVSGEIKIGMMLLQLPAIIYHRISRLSDYRINTPLPDSVFAESSLWTVDSSSVQQNPDSTFAENPEVVPFSSEEQAAYLKLDSTKTLEKAYQPTGPLARFVKVEADYGQDEQKKKSSWLNKALSGVSPSLAFNRVEALRIGLKKPFRLHRDISAWIFGGYQSGPEETFWGSGFRWNNISAVGISLSAEYSKDILPRYSSINYSRFLNSIPALLGYRDYFDYYQARGSEVKLRIPVRPLKSETILAFHAEKHSSVSTHTDYNFRDRESFGRNNPAIAEIRMNSFEIRWRSLEDFIPLGIVGQNWLELFAERSSPEILNSDVSFTRAGLLAEFYFNTFLRRRLLPNQLHVRLTAGVTDGDLLSQRTGILDGSLHGFAPFGVFRTLSGRPYEGDKYFAVFWEHNFRTVPFELLGLRWLAKKNISVILHGASGRTWISEKNLQALNFGVNSPESFHHEVGLGINGLFSLFRIDVTRRLDKPELFLSFGLARLF